MPRRWLSSQSMDRRSIEEASNARDRFRHFCSRLRLAMGIMPALTSVNAGSRGMPAFLFFVHSFSSVFYPEAGRAYLQVHRVRRFLCLRACGALSSGRQPWMGRPPHIAAYRFWYPRMRSQRSSINLFCDNPLHISPGKLDQTEKTPHGAGNQHRADWSWGQTRAGITAARLCPVHGHVVRIT